MANDVSNGSTLSFATVNQADLRSISYTVAGNPVDVTVLASANMFVEIGIPDITVSAEMVGVSTIDVGDAGAVSVAFFDGTTIAYDAMICTSKDIAASGINTEITTSLEFKPNDPLAAA